MRLITPSRFRKWLMIYAVLLLVISDFFLIEATIPTVFNGYTIYPFVLNFDGLRFQLACLVIPISIIGVFIAAFALKMQPVLHPLIVGALLAANAIACCSRFIGLAVIDKQQASIQFENHIYNVIGTEQFAGPGDARWVTLYECDSHNFLCQIIFNKYVLSTDATLVANPTSHTVTPQIDSKTVYVHQVK